jgi:aminoglycoside phosphotransferase (APT) family kinase protein
MHDRFSSQDSARALPPHTLIDYNQQFYRRWLRRARAVLTDPATDWLLRRYESAIARLLELPRGLIHGEFYPANVLVQGTGPDARICPVDWEMAACAPPLMDLAAFVAGRWSDTERARLVAAYRDHTTTSFADPDFAACRLHVAVQWLAWSRRWVPPAAQRHDWLGEARQVAEELAA